MDNTALRMEILRYYYAHAHRTDHANFCQCAHLAERVCVSGIELDNEVDYLKRKGYLSGSYMYGMKPAEGEYRITKQGIDFLEKKHCPNESKTTFRRII